MRKGIMLMLGLIVCLGINSTCCAAQTIVAQKVATAPVIDGIGNDPVWEKAQAIVTHDKVADIDVILKAVYTDKEIYFLVIFPDTDESRSHKSWIWHKIQEVYGPGNDREDSFIFKWNMDIQPVDLSIYADNPYKADIWFWKAMRTDRIGYADDKTQILSTLQIEKSIKLTSKSGKNMYLLRNGDKGQPAYKTDLQIEYVGDLLPRFANQEPTQSRADVKAKGNWHDGKWAIEFGRILSTGYDDDIQFDPIKSFQFGISRFEIAGRSADPESNQPLYGCGDINEAITLIFSK